MSGGGGSDAPDDGSDPDGGEEGEAQQDVGEYDHRRLDELVHSRIRLAVLSLLAGADDAQFTYLRDEVNTTDGNLSTHLRKLEEAGYVDVDKGFRDRKPVTRYRMTEEGRRAFREYVERLGAMVGSEPPGGESG